MQIKTGNVEVLSQVSFLLVEKIWPLQVRIYASKMLQVLCLFHLLFIILLFGNETNKKKVMSFWLIEIIKAPLLICLIVQYLVKLRWDELCSAEQMDISSASFELMSEVASDPCEECEMKSETITLVAEVKSLI